MNAGMAYSAHNGQDNRSGLGTKLQAPVVYRMVEMILLVILNHIFLYISKMAGCFGLPVWVG